MWLGIAERLAEWRTTLRLALLLFVLATGGALAIALVASWVPVLSIPVAVAVALLAALVTSKLPLRRDARL